MVHYEFANHLGLYVFTESANFLHHIDMNFGIGSVIFVWIYLYSKKS